MSAAIEVDGRILEINEASNELREAITACENHEYRKAVQFLCNEITRLSVEIEELKDELYGV